MRLIEDVKTLVWFRENSASPHSQICQYEVMINNDAINAIQFIPRPIKAAVSKMAAFWSGTLIPIDSQRPPITIGNRFFPIIAITLPVAASNGIQHLNIKRLITINRKFQLFSV